MSSVLASLLSHWARGDAEKDGWDVGQEGEIVIPEDLNKQVIKIQVLQWLHRF